MRNLLGIFAAWALLLGVAATASAAPRDFTGTLGIGIGTLPPVEMTGTDASVINNSAGGAHVSSFTVPGGVFSAQVTVPITDPTVSGTIPSLRFAITNLPGSFAGLSGGSGGGQMALGGSAKVCLFSPGCLPGLSLNVPFFNGVNGVGIGGTILAAGAVNITVGGLGPWTQATASIVNTVNPADVATAMGFGHGPASVASSTNANSGEIQLVTPLDIRTSLVSAFPQIPSFATMTLHFAPEPGGMLLAGAGVATLALLGRRRRRA